MTTNKKSVAMLADILIKKGLEYLVHSPGSRNAPIIIAFSHRKEVKIITCVDERSAAFYALGLALETGKTVAIDCTSGTASLNYAPAIAEAFYQHIPLLVLTADRSPEHINIGDGQTINQEKLYTNYIKASFSLPQSINEQDDFLKVTTMAHQAMDMTTTENPGPVHINIPLSEPLYGQTDESPVYKEIIFPEYQPKPVKQLPPALGEQLRQSVKVMVIAGQMIPNKEINLELGRLTEKKGVVVLTETTSNLYHPEFIDGIDNVISTFGTDETPLFKPQLLITLGGAVVSKMIKKYLRNNQPQFHWHISPSGENMDTYFCLTETIKGSPQEVLQLINDLQQSQSTEYKSLWLKKKTLINQRRQIFLAQTQYSDLQVFNTILNHLPRGINLHLGNSTPVRYSQLFGSLPSINYYSNRGVSGIDGQISTAAGIASASPEKLNVLITGDLGFLYDSNGLLLLQHCPNLKIIVINNQGGGIFRFIPGPDTVEGFEQYFEAQHPLQFEYLTKAFGLDYLKATNPQELKEQLPKLFQHVNQSVILEIYTPQEENGVVLRNYFKALKS